MTVRILRGHVLDRLRELPDESVHCCVTSPPYYGLRDYGTAKWVGGSDVCDHRSPTMREGRNEDRAKLAGSPATNSAQLLLAHRSVCGKCGAVKQDGQLGLEPTLDEYIANMVAVFREVRRVLRPDGTLWLNIGDSYAARIRQTKPETAGAISASSRGVLIDHQRPLPPGFKEKDLMGVPWRLAFALQADGWYLRSDIIWHKRSTMPESVRDRPTKSHEHIFLLAKSESYYYDQAAASEPAVHAGRVVEYDGTQKNSAAAADQKMATRVNHTVEVKADRNWRDVWSLGPEPFKEAHFATFPTEIPRRAIVAGCPPHGVVLDPFLGSGTTALVADRLQRDCIGIELNPAYADMAERRIRSASPLFAEVSA